MQGCIIWSFRNFTDKSNPKDLNVISHIWNEWKQWKGHEPNPDRGWITINKNIMICKKSGRISYLYLIFEELKELLKKNGIEND